MARRRHFRWNFLAGGAKAAALFLFGTPGLSGVSVFATPQAIGGDRSRRKVNDAKPGRAMCAIVMGQSRRFIVDCLRFGR
jgi:hypothetical protein